MITTVRIDTIDAHSARSACVHTAIVNISTLVDGGNYHWLRSVFPGSKLLSEHGWRRQGGDRSGTCCRECGEKVAETQEIQSEPRAIIDTDDGCNVERGRETTSQRSGT